MIGNDESQLLQLNPNNNLWRWQTKYKHLECTVLDFFEKKKDTRKKDTKKKRNMKSNLSVQSIIMALEKSYL